MTAPRQLSLNAFIYPAGHHEAAWRHPASGAERIYDVAYYQEIARTAEAAKLDAVFFADGPALLGERRLQRRRHGSSRSRCSPRSPR